MDDHFIYVVISTYVIDRFQKDQTGTALICFVSDGISGRHKFYSAVLFQFFVKLSELSVYCHKDDRRLPVRLVFFTMSA